MTNKVKQDLTNFKVKISELSNYSSEENIENAISIIKQLSTYIFVNIKSANREKAYEELQILLNWINEQSFEEDNHAKMIILKENAVSSIELLLSDREDKTLADLKKKRNNNIFIVHGHKNEMKLAVSAVIKKLGLEPIILHELPDKNRTIIEKFEEEAEKASFAIVLISPDDEVDVEKEKSFRARQNVILELGYFIGKLGRENVLALYDITKGDIIELPSDISGILYKPYNEFDSGWNLHLADELKAAGYNIDKNNL